MRGRVNGDTANSLNRRGENGSGWTGQNVGDVMKLLVLDIDERTHRHISQGERWNLTRGSSSRKPAVRAKIKIKSIGDAKLEHSSS